MKAICFDRYGGPEELYQTNLPQREPTKGEFRVRIQAATVTAGDCELRRFDVVTIAWLPLRLYMGVFKPRKRVLGSEFSGVVDAVGPETSKFKVGDAVYGITGMNFGTYQEYRCFSEKQSIVPKPENISFQEAAGIPIGGLNALHFLRLAQLKKGERILVVGATGSIGIMAVQLAVDQGAEVTAVCPGHAFELMKQLGVSHCIDYRKSDYWKLEERYDLVFEAIGKTTMAQATKVLDNNGRCILANPKSRYLIRAPFFNAFNQQNKRVILKFAGEPIEDLIYLNELLKSNRIRMVIDRSFPLEQVKEAHHYVEQGEKIGNVVIDVSGT